MNCLWCHEEISITITWETLLFLLEPSQLCNECRKQLEKLKGDRCQFCSRNSNGNENICEDCLWWRKYMNGHDCLTFNHSLYVYNSFMQEIITKWKYRGDYILGTIFQTTFRKAFSKKFTFKENDVYIVPIPLSEDRLKERGFNQAEMLASFLNIQPQHLLSRITNDKQSKKTRKERLLANNPFKLTVETINKPVILVDDIYTTGTTIRHAASILKAAGSPKIYSYTLIRG